jgi:hypothetical protein
VHLVGFIVKIFHDARSHVTMHDHMNVKKKVYMTQQTNHNRSNHGTTVIITTIRAVAGATLDAGNANKKPKQT